MIRNLILIIGLIIFSHSVTASQAEIFYSKISYFTPPSYGKASITLPANHYRGRYVLSGKVENMDFKSDINLFYQEINNAIAAAQNKSILVFIHGFSNSWRDALITSAHLKNDIPYSGIIIAFAWPNSTEILDYPKCYNFVKNPMTGIYLSNFLRDLSLNTEADEINIIGHSLGALYFLSSLLNNPSDGIDTWDTSAIQKYNNLVFVSPDVSYESFNRCMTTLNDLNFGKRRTIYVNTYDEALDMAAKHVHRKMRAGEIKPNLQPLDNVDVIDISAFNRRQYSEYGHSLYRESPEVLNDLYWLLEKNLDVDNPDRRLIKK